MDWPQNVAGNLVASALAGRFIGDMADIRVRPAQDVRRLLDTVELVRFAEPSREPPAQAISGIREGERFAAAPGVADRLRAAALHAGALVLGSVVRARDTYEMFGGDTPKTLRGKEPQRILFATRDGRDVGYAWFRRKQKWDQGRPDGTVEVGELVGDPVTELALPRRLVDLDLTSSVVLNGRGSTTLSSPGRVGTATSTAAPRTASGCDSSTCLSPRQDAGMPRRSTSCPRSRTSPARGIRGWRLTVGADGVGHLERTDDGPDLVLTTQLLASAYLGSRGLEAARVAGLPDERRDGAARALDATLRMPLPPAAAAGF